MDPAINTAARALSAGNPLAALKFVALRDDAPSLVLRGIAMAQLDELGTARTLLRRASRKFTCDEILARARCTAALAEVELGLRELSISVPALEQAIAVLDNHGDFVNAAYARLIELRRLLILGRISDAEAKHRTLVFGHVPPMLEAIAELIAAELALRRVHAGAAADCLQRATLAAARARIPALSAEIEEAVTRLNEVAAREHLGGNTRALRLDQVEELLISPTLVVNACRRTVSQGDVTCVLTRRPVLFELARVLAEAWPGDVEREQLLTRVFAGDTKNTSWRGRLRVEVGRLRKEIDALATVVATARGYSLWPRQADRVSVLLPPIDGENAAMLALLGDGVPWSSSALALALGLSQRTVQRALSGLQAAGRVQKIGRARAQRWLAPPACGYTPALLLPIFGPGS